MGELLVLTRTQSRLVDRVAIDEYGIPGVVLMENAGRSVVDALLSVDPTLMEKAPPAPSPWRGGLGRGEAPGTGAPSSVERSPQVAILCGKGNNAGDGFVIARHLEIRGVAVVTILLCPPDELSGDALVNHSILARSAAPWVDLSAFASDLGGLPPALDCAAAGAKWLVDALLGTGATGAPREPLHTAIHWMNAQPARRLAVDVPSGLDCDTGATPGAVVRSDVTCTFVAPKPSFLQPAAAPFVGELFVLDIGVPPRVIEDVARMD